MFGDFLSRLGIWGFALEMRFRFKLDEIRKQHYHSDVLTEDNEKMGALL